MIIAISRNLILFISAAATAIFLFIYFFTVYQVQENSMEPILRNGQKIIAIRNERPRIGDIVIFENPEDSRLVVKKILLSPGDPVVISNGSLITPELNIPLTKKQQKLLAGLAFIPENMFFATGENIFNSRDSRDYGPVNIENLRGKVLLF